MSNYPVNNEEVSFNNSNLPKHEYIYAKNIISDLKSKGVFLSNSFYDDLWLFSHEYSSGRTIKLDFSKISLDLNNNDQLLIRCWISLLLEKYRPSTCIHYFHYFSKAVNITNFFSLSNINHFVEWLNENHITKNEKTYLLFTVFDFFNYSEIPSSGKYLAKLYDIRNKIYFVKNSIELPSSKNILLFSYYLGRYFDDIKKDKLLNDEDIKKKTILFYPILIWWNLTTIIPIRSTEFCLIKRNCISKEDNKVFMTIPRIKKPLVDTNDYNDKIEINKYIYDLLSNYVELTKTYGESETLISYRSLIYADNTGRRALQKKDSNTFNKNNLEKLLNRFYKEVINEYYQINLPNDQKLSSNDTRHIAFVSLMMQGVSPVEIARLGGHKTIEAQYHYSFHQEYWIDNEVFKLIKKYKSFYSVSDDNIRYIPEDIKLKAFKAPTSNFRGELEIGYCSDSLIRCEAKECMLCSHWRIDLDDLKSEHHHILNKINQNRNNLIDLMNFIYKIHTKTVLNIMTGESLENDRKLEQTFIDIKSNLDKLSKLTQIERSID